MENLSKKIVENLKNKNETISFMESCTGGFLANEITNIDGASSVLKISLVTYSNEYKIKFGVNKKTINQYSVYSIETANEMAEQISKFAESDWGIGVTGELDYNSKDEVYYSIYNCKTQKFVNNSIIAEGNDREEKKEFVAKNVLGDLLKQIDGGRRIYAGE